MARAINLDLLNKLMQDMASEEKIFQNEAQFQFELAWRIRKELNHKDKEEYQVLLEHTFSDSCLRKDKQFVDIVIKSPNNQYVAIEVKYKKRGVDCKRYNKCIGNDAEQLFGRYDFFKDMERNENLIKANKVVKAYCILLTNEHLYWSVPNHKGNEKHYMYEPFRLDGNETGKVEFVGTYIWKNIVPKDITKKRKNPIQLDYCHKGEWNTYNVCNSSCVYYKKRKGHEFKYLIVKIEK